MAYQGNTPALNYISFAKQTFTIVNGQTSYTLDNSVANGLEILLYINNVKQIEGSGEAYTASGNTLTIASALTSGSDEMYCLFIGKAVQTVTPASGSVTNAMLGETITVAKGGTGLTSGFANGITEADQFRLTADLSTNVDPISSNLERVDDATFSKIGTGMSLSSGIYTFPVTGLYLVSTDATVSYSGNDNAIIEVYASSDSGSSYARLTQSISGSSASNITNSMHSSNFVNVTNASTFRVKFSSTSVSTANIKGNTDFNRTYFTFIRLGDSQ